MDYGVAPGGNVVCLRPVPGGRNIRVRPLKNDYRLTFRREILPLRICFGHVPKESAPSHRREVRKKRQVADQRNFAWKRDERSERITANQIVDKRPPRFLKVIWDIHAP